jgi:hypothetical protein
MNKTIEKLLIKIEVSKLQKKIYMMNKHITKKLIDEQTYRKITHKN